ncbi:MAG TPA: DoxX family protein, partial [Cytophaga sp.]|nr:DoxX family protein [Cytophaga sp.]
PALGIGSVYEIMKDPDSVKIIVGLGYPAYLAPFLGAARILALIAIFLPGFSRLKEWAYAGLVFDVTAAIYSQIAVGNPITYMIFPFIILLAIIGSYCFYHAKVKREAV